MKLELFKEDDFSTELSPCLCMFALCRRFSGFLRITTGGRGPGRALGSYQGRKGPQPRVLVPHPPTNPSTH